MAKVQVAKTATQTHTKKTVFIVTRVKKWMVKYSWGRSYAVSLVFTPFNGN